MKILPIFLFLCYNQAMNFIISQVMGGIALILVFISYFLNNKIHFLIFYIIGNIFYALSYIFINALVAGINSCFSIIRCIIIYIYDRQEKKIPWFYLPIFSFLYIAVGIVFFENYYDIIVMITPILFTLAMMMENMELLRYFMIIPNLMLVFYGILNGVYTSAVLDFIEVIVISISIVGFYVGIMRKKHFDKEYEKSYKIIKNVLFKERIN